MSGSPATIRREVEKGELLEGIPVHQWTDQDTAAEWCAVEVRTLNNWRKRGLPSSRTPDGHRFYAWPHTAIWLECLTDWSDGGRRRVYRVPFGAAWARRQYENACFEAGVAYSARVFSPSDDAPGKEWGR